MSKGDFEVWNESKNSSASFRSVADTWLGGLNVVLDASSNFLMKSEIEDAMLYFDMTISSSENKLPNQHMWQIRHFNG